MVVEKPMSLMMIVENELTTPLGIALSIESDQDVTNVVL